MNLDELKARLYKANVPERWYSLDEGLKADACILYKNYSKWECFYLDEKGDRHDYRVFDEDEQAYEYLWKKMERQLAVFNIPPRSDDGV
jgi:hypothetical protein